VASRLTPAVTARLETLIAVGGDGAEEDQAGEGGPPVLALIKTDPGNVSLDSMQAEIGKLRAVRAAGLPGRLFADVAPGCSRPGGRKPWWSPRRTCGHTRIRLRR
jgi:hypothetical protein